MWKQYRKTGTAEMREPTPMDTSDEVAVNKVDDEEWDGERGGKVARNPANHKDQYYVAKAFFDKNYEPV